MQSIIKIFFERAFGFGSFNYLYLMGKHTNRLIEASSPYLLQHAHNPVNWHQWDAEALNKAKAENKLIIVSIGYAACHWCHVMERESFESQEVAEVMNQHFICIKVDREERPDIDQIYMLAVQLMNGNGGWPLNAICLPDKRPVYGGTYFSKNDWINILQHVAKLWADEPAKVLNYAERLTEGIKEAEKINPVKTDLEFNSTQIEEIVKPWVGHFDILYGGYNRAPKFPLPNNWLFLLRYSHLTSNQATFTATINTLEQMSMGGIYDQIGGGFARYSVDGLWHVPHFEKMLYDNAQLISLYSEAYQAVNYEPFKQIAVETINWVFLEMYSPEGLFYSSLDADSEGIEGKFYVWDIEEFKEILGDDKFILAKYFNVSEEGNWEEKQTNVLHRIQNDKGFTAQHPDIDLPNLVKTAKIKLLAQRNKRIRPTLDDKIITAWNALMIKALADASQIFNKYAYLKKASKAMNFILKNMLAPDGGLYRNYKNRKAFIKAFLDDYALVIDALITLYEADFNEKWLYKAQELTNYVIAHFTDDTNEMFFYVSDNEQELIARKHEIMDNVIPSSNSVMAQNLQKLALFFDNNQYADKASAMLKTVLPKIKTYGSAYSNWCIQLLNEVYGINEIAVTGNAKSVKQKFIKRYFPNKIMLGGKKSTLPLLKDKQSNETKIYVCRNKTCRMPVSTVDEAVIHLI